ncbi:Bacteriophage coat protein B [compost metagenome]
MSQNLQSLLRRSVGATTAAVGTACAFVGSAVFAAVPAEATGALTTAGEDTNTIGWAVFAVLVGAAAFKYMRRAL